MSQWTLFSRKKPVDGAVLLVKGGYLESDLDDPCSYDVALVRYERDEHLRTRRCNLRHTCFYEQWVSGPTHWMEVPK